MNKIQLILLIIISSCIFSSCASTHQNAKIAQLKNRIEELQNDIVILHEKVAQSEDEKINCWTALKDIREKNIKTSKQDNKELFIAKKSEEEKNIFYNKCLTSCHKAMQSGKKVEIKPEIYSPAGWFYFLEYDSKHQNILNDAEKDLILKFLGSESVPSGF